MKIAIDSIRNSYFALAEKLGAPKWRVAFHESRTDSGTPHVEYEGSDLCYVVTARGSEHERRRTQDPDTLLYWLVRDLTFDMACAYELKHRRRGEDIRRQLFAKQLELLGQLKPEWREICEIEFKAILEKNPYRDERGR